MKKRIFLSVLVAAALSCILSATSVFAADLTPATITLDKSYLERAVVSETPVLLEAEVRNAASQKIWDAEVTYTVTAGTDVAEITDGNKLTVKKAGSFTVCAACTEKPEVREEYTGTAYELTFANVRFNNKFENITVYTQPIKLTGNLDVTGIVAPGDVHYELVYSVVSGPAEIYCDCYLRITGKGDVVIEAASRYDPSVKVSASFTVTDPDEGKTVSDEGEYEQGDLSGGCSSSAVGASACLGAAAIALSAAMIKKRR